MKLKSVVHFKRTPLALAPDDLSEAINRYTSWTSRIVNDAGAMKDLPSGTVVHFHNQFAEYDGPQLIQYHSEPENRNCMSPSAFPETPNYRLVIAQYHATLPEYSGCHVVRNLINFKQPLFDLNPTNTPRIGYSPSTKFRINRWFDKGYEETVRILERISHSLDVEIDVITDVAYDECIRRKSACSVLIDECKTGSYHRCALESLALGKITVCYVSPAVDSVVHSVTGEFLPVTNSRLDQLEETLINSIIQPPAVLQLIGAESRRWMEEHWHPQNIVDDFIQHYERVVG